MARVHTEPRPDLLEAYRRLPAAAPLRDRLGDAGGLYLVGGAVRDLLRGEPPDLDFVVDGELDPVVMAIGGSLMAYDRFGTATIAVDGFRYDLARARRERYPHPGALPEVEPAPIGEDLERRDFTVNAMALGLGGDDAGTLLSVDRAREDLDARRLRVLHDASFTDDPTRLLRLARYAARLGFAVEPHTRRARRRRHRRRRPGHGQRRPGRRRTAPAGRRARPGGGLCAAARARHRPGAGPRLRARWPRAGPPRAGAAAARRRPRRPGDRRCRDGHRGRPARVAPGHAGLRGPSAGHDPGRGHRCRARGAGARTGSAPVGDRRRRRRPRCLARAGRLGRGVGPGVGSGPSGWTHCGTCGSRSTGTTCSRPEFRPARQSGGGCGRRWRPSSTAWPPTARPSWPTPSMPPARVELRRQRRSTYRGIALPAMRVAEPFYLRGRALRDRPGPGAGAVHHPSRRSFPRPLREPQPGPADRR